MSKVNDDVRKISLSDKEYVKEDTKTGKNEAQLRVAQTLPILIVVTAWSFLIMSFVDTLVDHVIDWFQESKRWVLLKNKGLNTVFKIL